MELPFGFNAYSRRLGNIAEIPVVNMFAEAAPIDGRVILQSFRGLREKLVVGAGPVRGLYQQDGVLSGNLITVSGDQAFSGGSLLGAISGTGAVSFAGFPEGLTICAGGPLYQTGGTGITQIPFPDTPVFKGGAFIKTLDLAGYNIAIEANSARIWFRFFEILSFDGFDYATAENEPDMLLDGQAIDDYLVLFGSQTTEFWPKTGNAEAPFQPLQGRVFERGIRATGCCAPFADTVAWVSNENIVYLAGNAPDKISDSGIEERLARTVSCAMSSFFFEGHEFLQIRGDDFTVLFNAQTGQWCERKSWGMANFRGAVTASGPVFGDATNGRVWEFGPDFVDAGGVLERRFAAATPLDGPVVIDSARVAVNVGQTPFLTGTYENPQMEMRTSNDAAQTFSDWESSDLGAQGNYRVRPEWRRLGLFDDPGIYIEFRVTDPVPLRVSRVDVNATKGGRGR